MSLNEEITRPKKPLPKAQRRELPQMTKPTLAPLHSTCPICLGNFDNMLYLSPCLHRFCFLCTQDLLETKAECPFCNQPFGSVFHPVKVKGHPAELPSLSPTRRFKASSPTKKHSKKTHISLSPHKHRERSLVLPSKRHPKEEHIPLHEISHYEEPISLTGEDKSSPERLSHPLRSPVQKRLPRTKREVSTGICSHKPYSVKPSLEDDLSPGGIKNHQILQKCLHLSVLGKKPNSDATSSESMQNEKVPNTTEGLPKFGDCEPDSLYYRATSAKLSRPNILEAILLLFSSGILLFLCIYTYLSLILLYK